MLTKKCSLELLKEELKNCKSTFKEISSNSKKTEYLCANTSKTVYDFDQYKNQSNPKLKSSDAIYIKNDKLYVIEFKNWSYEDLKEKQLDSIKGKLADSCKLLTDICDIKSSEIEVIFCLVHNDIQEPTNNESKNKIRQRPNQKTIAAKLAKFDQQKLNHFYCGIKVASISDVMSFYKNTQK